MKNKACWAQQPAGVNNVNKVYVISNYDVNQIAIGLEIVIPYAIIVY